MIKANKGENLEYSTKSCLFINNIDPKMPFKRLFDLFGQYGTIKGFLDFNSKPSKFKKKAYIKYSNEDEAERALRETQYLKVERFELTVMLGCDRSRLTPSNKIFIKNISRNTSNKELHSIFYSIPSKYYVNVVADQEGRKLDHGFIQLFDSNYTDYVLNNFQGIILNERVLELKPWEIKQQRQESKNISKNKTLYLSNIKENVSKEKLLSAFQEFGEIVSSDLRPSRYKKFGLNTYYAVLEFKTEEEAERTIAKAPKNKNIEEFFISNQNNINYFNSKGSQTYTSKKKIPEEKKLRRFPPFPASNFPFSIPYPFQNTSLPGHQNTKKAESNSKILKPTPVNPHSDESFYSNSNKTFQSNKSSDFSYLRSPDDTLTYEKNKQIFCLEQFGRIQM